MVREIEAETGILRTTVHRNLTEHLFKKKGTVWWVPHAQTDVQRQTRLEIAQKHYLKCFRKGDNFLNWIIATDETWIWDFKPNVWKLQTLP